MHIISLPGLFNLDNNEQKTCKRKQSIYSLDEILLFFNDDYHSIDNNDYYNLCVDNNNNNYVDDDDYPSSI